MNHPLASPARVPARVCPRSLARVASLLPFALGIALGLPGRAAGDEARASPGSAPDAARADALPDARPDLVFLLADDLRADALGCTGHPFLRTPHIDGLAARGALFENAFVTTSICAVSRASIFTGQYARRHGIHDFSKTFSPEQLAATYPALLRAAGYRTGFVGKFGVGAVEPTGAFDSYAGFPGQGEYFPAEGEGVHLTRLMTRQAIDFLADDDPRPRCLSVSFKAPHAIDGRTPDPYPADPEDEGLFSDVVVPPARLGSPEDFAAMPEFLRVSEGRTRWEHRFSTPESYQRNVKAYWKLVAGIDRAVGEIVAAVEASGRADRTIFVFASDNGYFLGERGLTDKWLMYEESIRVPLIVCDPRVPESARGRRVRAPALNLDIAPTLLDLAGLPVPDGMQGRSLAPWSAWTIDAEPARADFFYEHLFAYGGRIPRVEGVRGNRWKYTRYLDFDPPHEELFDLESDPGETRNLAGEGPFAEPLARMRARWEALRGESGPAGP